MSVCLRVCACARVHVMAMYITVGCFKTHPPWCVFTWSEASALFISCFMLEGFVDVDQLLLCNLLLQVMTESER